MQPGHSGQRDKPHAGVGRNETKDCIVQLTMVHDLKSTMY